MLDMYESLSVKTWAEDQIEEFYGVALAQLDKLSVSDEKLKPLRELAAYLMKREI